MTIRRKTSEKSARSAKRRLTGPDAAPRYTPSIAARSIDGHVLRTGAEIFAWYRLSPQRWSFRSDSGRENLIHAVAGQYAELQGRWLHLCVTSRPFPVGTWAAAHVDNALDRLPDVPGGLSWDDYMIGEQHHLMGRTMDEKEVYLGVQVQTRNAMDRAVERAAPVLRKILPEAVDAELVALDAEISHLDQIIGSSGLDGRPVTAAEMQWLMYRSCTLGLPAPRSLPAVTGTWAQEDLASFCDAASFHSEPYGTTVAVRGRDLSNAGIHREVIVLTVGLMQELDIPARDDPWIQRVDRLGIPVEISARIYVEIPEDVAGKLKRQLGKVNSQLKHYTEEHELDAPQELARQAEQVSNINDNMRSGWTNMATRVKSWWRIAVVGDTAGEALGYAQAVVNLYKPRVGIEHPEAQHGLLREFIPGEPLTSSAYVRRGSVIWAAAAMPTATADVGDRRSICSARPPPPTTAPWPGTCGWPRKSATPPA